MSEIALYNAFTKLGLKHDEAKEAVADVASSKNVATKMDISEVKADIAELKANSVATKMDIAELKADNKATKMDIAELKSDNKAIKWMLGLLLAINVAYIVSAVGLMIRFL